MFSVVFSLIVSLFMKFVLGIYDNNSCNYYCDMNQNYEKENWIRDTSR